MNFFFHVILLILLLVPLGSKEYTTQNTQILIDWEKYMLKASTKLDVSNKRHGNNFTDLKEYAKKEILMNLSSFLEDIIVNDKKKLKDILAVNKTFMQEYSVFMDALEPSDHFLKDDHIYLQFLISLTRKKGIVNILPVPWDTHKYTDLEDAKYVGEAYLKAEVSSSFSKSFASGLYTGLILDLRGNLFQPSLLPKIYSEDGRLFYGAAFLKRNIGVNNGVVVFSKRIDSERVKKRVGRWPFYAVALGVKGKMKTDAVISYEDAAKILGHKDLIQNLLNARVALIID